ncbi:ATP-binding protein [Actinophytocola xinjiangensis]|uniref:histidine kinase n=1 Tax=Actinophytocola xinjiangensis TaxID=485602 RepID=A0A7Z1AZU7_9PSEU|nr:ATP-binding protein [Actinophytocola xinjiangensis]OLF11134.1 ATP-binding protein [Actinophytocola xinjiangensis]
MSARAPVSERSQRSSLTDALFALLVAVVVTGVATVWIVLRVPEDHQLPVALVAGGLSVALCVAVGTGVYAATRVQVHRARLAALERESATLVNDVVPAAAGRVRDGATATTVLNEFPRPANGIHRELLRTVTREVGVSERQRAAVMAACASAAGRVQAMATSMLAELREMEGRHSEEVLGDLLKLDHSTAQTGRLADSIAVLTGARSGRRWTRPIVMESILRGAMGRIRAYQRVRVHSGSEAAIVGYAAEDVMHALAELMDNATRFSAPTEEVHVYVEELHSGVVVTIEDGGLGMKPQALSRAEAVVSTDGPLDLARLSGSRLGLVVVGALARKHKLHVYFRPSSRGGTGVVVRVPNQLVVHPREEADLPAPSTLPMALPTTPSPQPRRGTARQARGTTAVLDPDPPPRPEPEPGQLAARPTEDDPGQPPEPDSTPEDTEPPDKLTLPKRPRGSTLARVRGASEPPVPPRPKPRTDLAARFSAFQQGSRTPKSPDGGQTTDPSAGPSATGEDDHR